MARLQAGRGGNFDVHDEWEYMFKPMKPFSETETKAVFKDSLGNKVTIYGTNLDSSNEDKIRGNVSRVEIEDDKGRLIWDITKVSNSYKELWGPVQNTWEYGILDFMTVLMDGDDTHIGTDGSEHMPVTLDSGNDVIKALGGDDFVRAGPGDNDMDGGKGVDTLAYHPYWYGSAPQKRGAYVDVADGTAVNPWAGDDTIDGFEVFRLTIRNDIIKGSDTAREWYELLDGKDNLNGRGGFDTVDYSKDSWYEGLAGVTVNLATGKATDGFGKTDTLTNVEGIVGTDENDDLTGNDVRNEIAGLAGNDRLRGNGGSDIFIFNYGFKKDVVEDFQANGNKHDIIRLVDYDDFNKFSDLKPLLKQVGDDVVINKGGDDEITLLDVDLDSLAGKHFEFA